MPDLATPGAELSPIDKARDQKVTFPDATGCDATITWAAWHQSGFEDDSGWYEVVFVTSHGSVILKRRSYARNEKWRSVHDLSAIPALCLSEYIKRFQPATHPLEDIVTRKRCADVERLLRQCECHPRQRNRRVANAIIGDELGKSAEAVTGSDRREHYRRSQAAASFH